MTYSIEEMFALLNRAWDSRPNPMEFFFPSQPAKAPPIEDSRLDPVDIIDRIDELVNESLARGKVDRR